MHLNRNALLGLAVVALAVLAVAPQAIGTVLPLLIIAICPLSMVLMMRGMSGHGRAHGAGCHGDHGTHEQRPAWPENTAAPPEASATDSGDPPHPHPSVARADRG